MACIDGEDNDCFVLEALHTNLSLFERRKLGNVLFKYWINALLTTTPIGSHDMCNRIRFQPVDRHKYIFVFQRRVFLEEISEEQHYRFWAHPIMCLEAINIAFFSTPVDSFIRKSSIDETIPKDFF